jgi:acetyl esterase/lipase
MSRRAKFLLLCLRCLKKRQHAMATPLSAVRRRLRFIERIVPWPPAGTQTDAIDADGVNAVRIIVPQSRIDRYVLFFHGGGYVVGSAPLYRDFTWRIAVAARACVLYFDYRLAPEHPFPAALDDAVKAYRWLADRLDHRQIAFLGDSAGGGLAFAALQKLRDQGLDLPGAVVAVSPWTDLALTGPSLQSNAWMDPMMNVTGLAVTREPLSSRCGSCGRVRRLGNRPKDASQNHGRYAGRILPVLTSGKRRPRERA